MVTVNVPGASVANIIANVNSNVSIPTANGNVYINANAGVDQQTVFNTDGTVSFPAISTQGIVISGPNVFSTGGALRLYTGGPAGPNHSNLTIGGGSNGYLYYSNDTASWAFNTDGSTRLPTDSNVYAQSGNITLTADVVANNLRIAGVADNGGLPGSQQSGWFMNSNWSANQSRAWIDPGLAANPADLDVFFTTNSLGAGSTLGNADIVMDPLFFESLQSGPLTWDSGNIALLVGKSLSMFDNDVASLVPVATIFPPATTVVSGNVTNTTASYSSTIGNTFITLTSSPAQPLFVGMVVNGPDITADSYITSIVGTVVNLSAAVISTGSGTATFDGVILTLSNTALKTSTAFGANFGVVVSTNTPTTGFYQLIASSGGGDIDYADPPIALTDQFGVTGYGGPLLATPPAGSAFTYTPSLTWTTYPELRAYDTPGAYRAIDVNNVPETVMSFTRFNNPILIGAGSDGNAAGFPTITGKADSQRYYQGLNLVRTGLDTRPSSEIVAGSPAGLVPPMTFSFVNYETPDQSGNVVLQRQARERQGPVITNLTGAGNINTSEYLQYAQLNQGLGRVAWNGLSLSGAGTLSLPNPVAPLSGVYARAEGNFIGSSTITGASGTGTVATLTFSSTLGATYTVGQIVVVSNMNPAGYDGTYTITAATSSSISYACAETGAFVSGGTAVLYAPANAPAVGNLVPVVNAPTGLYLQYTAAGCATGSPRTFARAENLTTTVSGGNAVALKPVATKAPVTVVTARVSQAVVNTYLRELNAVQDQTWLQANYYSANGNANTAGSGTSVAVRSDARVGNVALQIGRNAISTMAANWVSARFTTKGQYIKSGANYYEATDTNNQGTNFFKLGTVAPSHTSGTVLNGNTYLTYVGSTAAEGAATYELIVKNAETALTLYDKNNTTNIATFTNSLTTFNTPVQFPAYTAAAANALTGSLGQQICISDSASGGNPNGMMAFWDTTHSRWSYVHDNSAV